MQRVQFKLLPLLFIAASIFSQQMKMIQASDAVLIHEIKCIVKLEDGSLIADIFAPHGMKTDAQEVDLQTGDEILFINGKRVKTIEETRKAYEETPIGEKIELGVKRNNERFFTSFTRSEMKGGNMMMIKKDEAGNVTASDGAEVKDGKIIINGKEVDLDSLEKSGKMKIIQKTDSSKTNKK